MAIKRFFEKRTIRPFFVLLCLILISGCATVDVPNVGEDGYTLEQDERRLKKRSDEICEVIDDTSFIYNNPALEKYLNDTANKLLPESAKAHDIKISVKIINDPALNAFALPNGRIYVHMGMLAAVDNEAEMAALLGHEMTHVIHRHSLRQFRSIINKTAFFSSIQSALAFGGGNLAVLLGALVIVSSVYGYSREMERDADECGFKMMMNNDYDPKEAVKLFEHLKQYIEDEDIKQPFFFSTHPNVVERIRNFKEFAKLAPQNKDYIVNEVGYFNLTKVVILHNADLNMDEGAFKSAERNINKFLGKFPENAEGHYCLAELYRQRQDVDKKSKEKTRPKADDYKKAIEEYDASLSCDNTFAAAYRGKGRVLRSLDNGEEAKTCFVQYLELMPNAEDRSYIERYLNN